MNVRRIPWNLDLDHEAAVARIRALILGTVSLVAAGITATMQVIAPDLAVADPVTMWLLTGSFASVGLLSLVSGKRLNDLAYLLLNLIALAFATVYLCQLDPSRTPAFWAMNLLNSTIMPTVFCVHRRNVVIAAGAGITAILAVIFVQAPSQTNPIPAFLGVVFTVPFIVLVVRVLRELAGAAVQRANRGEITDPLTGALNRRGLEQLGAVAWREQALAHQPLMFLVIDIDHFKQVNDSLGHAAGDELIQRTVQAIQAVSREDDVVVRLGGEEFLLLARSGAISTVDAVALADRLRRRVQHELYPATVSIGTYEMTPSTDDELPAALWRGIDTADRALLQAKQGGRNRVVTAAPT